MLVLHNDAFIIFAEPSTSCEYLFYFHYHYHKIVAETCLIHGTFLFLMTYHLFAVGSRKLASLHPMVNTMNELQKKMKTNCLANQSLDLFDITERAAIKFSLEVLDHFFVANASFTSPRLHEMMLVSWQPIFSDIRTLF